ncbi:hypothetical protein HPP92_008427 [Vanilla planifolia]|uniref:Uncharacterized protein n=1 Tax=Vanilla planifolia TaxID=51239 RepID=A0A835R635_VANPL|nr:hypothetical protein HPP92_008427 [Vanilla planifolia]
MQRAHKKIQQAFNAIMGTSEEQMLTKASTKSRLQPIDEVAREFLHLGLRQNHPDLHTTVTVSHFRQRHRPRLPYGCYQHLLQLPPPEIRLVHPQLRRPRKSQRPRRKQCNNLVQGPSIDSCTSSPIPSIAVPIFSHATENPSWPTISAARAVAMQEPMQFPKKASGIRGRIRHLQSTAIIRFVAASSLTEPRVFRRQTQANAQDTTYDEQWKRRLLCARCLSIEMWTASIVNVDRTMLAAVLVEENVFFFALMSRINLAVWE